MRLSLRFEYIIINNKIYLLHFKLTFLIWISANVAKTGSERLRVSQSFEKPFLD
jgi:hypothetical protein